MIIGIPKEVKTFEYRVAMTPHRVGELIQRGHQVLVQRGAGLGSGFKDSEYQKVGANIVSTLSEVYRRSEFVIKVKEPQSVEYNLLRPGLILFTFLHLAANRLLEQVLQKKKVRAVAYEDVKTAEGLLPLLAPMSEIAGLLAPLIGANYLRKDLGGKGALLPAVGLGGTGHVTVIGAGHAGSQAVKAAHGMGASVSVYDINTEKLKKLEGQYPERLEILSDISSLPSAIQRTDLLIGAALVPGRRAPLVVTRRWVQLMEVGSVIVDVAVDQGGCIETIHATTLKDPVYKKYGIIHYGVTNIPSLVPKTATEALSAATLPYVFEMTEGRFPS